MGEREPSEDEHDAKRAAVEAWLRESYGFTDEQFDEGEISVVYDGEGHWVFDVWKGEAYKSEGEGTGYIHPSGHIEGLY